jgi:hypothetical protein
MRDLRLILLPIAALVVSANAEACEITRLMSGNTEVSDVINHWDGSAYKTYLVRNNVRDQEGILNNWIKFELIPQRWGFDLELPNGRRFGQINKILNRWEVSASLGFVDSCASSYVTLRKSKNGKMDVYNGLVKIGEIYRFPFKKMF